MPQSVLEAARSDLEICIHKWTQDNTQATLDSLQAPVSLLVLKCLAPGRERVASASARNQLCAKVCPVLALHCHVADVACACVGCCGARPSCGRRQSATRAAHGASGSSAWRTPTSKHPGNGTAASAAACPELASWSRAYACLQMAMMEAAIEKSWSCWECSPAHAASMLAPLLQATGRPRILDAARPAVLKVAPGVPSSVTQPLRTGMTRAGCRSSSRRMQTSG